jgi:hypothetical protein
MAWSSGKREMTDVDRAQMAILDAVVIGELVAGDTLHADEWAAYLGVSLAAAREGIERLEERFIVDSSYTGIPRLVSFTPAGALCTAQSWVTEHLAIMSEVVRGIPETAFIELERARNAYRMCGPSMQHAESFHFTRTFRECDPELWRRKAGTIEAYRLRLAAPLLIIPRWAEERLHDDVLTAISTFDQLLARRGLKDWLKEVTTIDEPIGA